MNMIFNVFKIVIEVIVLFYGIIAVGSAAIAIFRKPKYLQFIMLWTLCGICFALYGAFGLALRYFDIPEDIAFKLDRYMPTLLGIALGISLSFMAFESMQKSNKRINSIPETK